MIYDALRGLVEGDVVALPNNNRSVQLNGVVSLDGGDVGGIDLYRRVGKCTVEVSALGTRLSCTSVVIETDAEVGGLRFVLYTHCRGAGRGLLKGFGNDHRNILSPVTDDFILEGRTHFAVGGVVVAGSSAVKGTDVAMVQHQQHAGHLLRGIRFQLEN